MASIDAGNDASTAIRAVDPSLQKSRSRIAPGGDSLGKDDFLKLLMAQVTNQDPLNPMDSQGMMDQLTGMSSLEQLMNINENIGALQDTQSDIVRFSTFSFLDKDVTIRGGGVSVSQGRAPGLQFRLGGEAESVRISIADGKGIFVRTLELGPRGPGAHSVAWDAVDNDGRPLSDGFYRVNISAMAKDEEPVPVDQIVRGKVSGIRFDNGRPMLKVNGEEIDVRDIIEMSNRSERIFGDRLPSALQQELRARPPVTRR